MVIETCFMGKGNNCYFAESVPKFSCSQFASHKEIVMMAPQHVHHADKWMIKQHSKLQTTEERNFVLREGQNIGQNTVIVRTQSVSEPGVRIEATE